MDDIGPLGGVSTDQPDDIEEVTTWVIDVIAEIYAKIVDPVPLLDHHRYSQVFVCRGKGGQRDSQLEVEMKDILWVWAGEVEFQLIDDDCGGLGLFEEVEGGIRGDCDHGVLSVCCYGTGLGCWVD